MKKHIIAAAVAAAIAVPAMAQNVSVYGVLDTGYGDFTRKLNGAADGSKKAVDLNNMATSRFGLRGTEDLGGGMKASFVIETGIGSNVRSGYEQNVSNTTGTRRGSGATIDATALGDRGLYAELDFGQGTSARLGFSSTPVRDFILAYDAAFGSNNVGNTAVNDDDFAANRRTGIKLSHKVGAITVSGTFTRNNDTDVDAKNASGWGYSAQYAEGALSVGYAQIRETQVNAAYAVGDALTAGNPGVTVASTAIAAFDGKRVYSVLGGSYDLKVAKIYASMASAKLTNDLGASLVGEGKKSSNSVGVQVPVGSTTLFGQYSSGTNKIAVVAGQAESRTTNGYTLGLQHNLSKRTSVYAQHGRTELATDVAGTRERDDRMSSVGLLHSF